MSDFEFVPTEKQVVESNIYRFMRKHNVSTIKELSRKARKDSEWFWRSVDNDLGIVWSSSYSKVLDASKGVMWSKWFVGGKTNIYKSSVEKFARSDPQKTAYVFVSEDGQTHHISYSELDLKTSQLAKGLRSLGIKKGDVIAVYMPMTEQAVTVILAAAKIGAVQTVIFSGYSSESLHVRLKDCKAKILFVTDGFQRKGRDVSQKKVSADAIKDTSVENIVIVPYKGVDCYDDEKPDNVIFYKELMSSQDGSLSTTEIMDSEDPLFVLYTSGTTGKPKGVIHTQGGFSVFAGYQARYLIDMRKDDVLFWPADIGWITGLVWNVYGLLIVGGTAVIYDGALDHPSLDRVWQMLSDYQVTIFGISPTAVRLFKKNNFEPRKKHSLKKLKNIPTTGEPIDEDSWRWLFDKVGDRKIPIMNLSGGTEIGGAMLSVLPGMKLKPSTVGIPIPGMNLDCVDSAGKSVRNQNGFLVVKSPWPAMTRGLLNDDSRYLETYWKRFEGIWFHGDYVCVDKDDLWYMHGRTDDIINVSGHRMSTAELEHAVMSHSRISDAACVAIPDEATGQAVIVFFVANDTNDTILESEVLNYISEKIGKIARPKLAIQLSDLPKTRTGKIMRRLLRSKLLGQSLGDVSSLENPGVLNEIQIKK